MEYNNLLYKLNKYTIKHAQLLGGNKPVNIIKPNDTRFSLKYYGRIKKLYILDNDNKLYTLVDIKPTIKILLLYINNEFFIISFDKSYNIITTDDDIAEYIKEELEELESLKIINSDTLKNAFNTQKQLLCITNFYKVVDISRAVDKLKEFNTKLNEKCKNLSLYLDFDYEYKYPLNISTEYNKIILSIIENKNCVSYISITPNIDNMDNIYILIDSHTLDDYQGKKFNKFLRGVLISIIDLMSIDGTKINTLKSKALNTASAYLLLKYFNGIDESGKFERYKQQFPGTDLRTIIETYYSTPLDIPIIYVNITEENVENAEEVAIKSLTTELRC
jgi:hypothetical protein